MALKLVKIWVYIDENISGIYGKDQLRGYVIGKIGDFFDKINFDIENIEIKEEE